MTGTLGFKDRNGDELDRIPESGELSTSIELESGGIGGSGTVLTDVFLALYDSRGMMLSVQSWNVAVSEINTVFMQTISIPDKVHVASVKLIVLSEDMTPIVGVGALTI